MNNTLFFTIIGLVISLVALGMAIFVFYKVRRLLQVGNQKDLAALIDKHFAEIISVQDAHKALLGELKTVGVRTWRSLQGVGFVRYNPFGDTGGNQSFSFCLIDAKKNGIIVSSLHSREGTRIYAKDVKKGESKHTLSEEEKAVLEEAVGSLDFAE